MDVGSYQTISVQYLHKSHLCQLHLLYNLHVLLLTVKTNASEKIPRLQALSFKDSAGKSLMVPWISMSLIIYQCVSLLIHQICAWVKWLFLEINCKISCNEAPELNIASIYFINCITIYVLIILWASQFPTNYNL